MTTQPRAPWRKLPDKPNLEQLKKQAKDLLRDYLAQDANAVAEVRLAEQSPSPDFALADAQRVLARAYGFPSWTKLKEHTQGITVADFCAAAGRGDVAKLKELLAHSGELVKLDMAGNDERTALHVAVMARQPDAVRLLMAAGADARKGVYPNRDATTALTIATDRGYDEIVAIIEAAEQARREDNSCPNATVTPAQDQINAAIKAGKTDDAITLLSADETLIKACDREGCSPLHIAAEAGDLKLVEWLLARRASVSKTDLKGLTPLDRAVYSVYPVNKGSPDRFKRVGPRLRLAGAPLTLSAAVALGEGEFLAKLHRENPKAFVRTGAVPGPLGVAVRHKQYDMIRLLLDLGQDVNETYRLDGLEHEQYSSGDPLWHAAQGNDLEAVTLLLDRGADPNAMLYASGTPTGTSRDPKIVKLMIDHGGKIMSSSAGGRGHTELARRLLQGLDLDKILPDTHPGAELAVQLCWGAACSGNPEVVRLALEHIDWPLTDKRWFYMVEQPMRFHSHGPGFWADNSLPREPYLECFRPLVARIDVNMVGRRGERLLHRVASDGTCWGHEIMRPEERVQFATMLLDAGARFDVRDELLRSSPLAWAARWGRTELVKLYLSRGCPKHEPDAEPWAAPLAWAKRYNRTEIIALLQ